MKENGLVSKHKRKFKVTTDTQHNYPICRNLLDQNFVVDRLNQVWISDITYIPTKKGWMYLILIFVNLHKINGKGSAVISCIFPVRHCH